MMNEAHRQLLKDNYVSAVHEYCEAFCKKHDWDYERDGWVAEDVGGCLEVNDMYIDFNDIRYDIDNDIDVQVFEEWYGYSSEIAMFDGGHNVNYKSWCRGYRPYTAEQLEAISEAHRKMREAESQLRELLEQYKAHELLCEEL